MANRYFDFPASLSRFVRNTLARASDINNRLDEVSVGFDTVQTEMDLKSPIASPTFTGTPAAPNPASVATDTTQIATTAWVQDVVDVERAAKAPIASPTFTGTPAAPNPPSVTTDSTQIATTAWVQDVIGATSVGLPVQTGNDGKFLSTNGTSASWASAVPYVTRSARTSNTILEVADRATFIDITSGTFTQTFTAAATLGNGWWCYIRNSGTGDVTLDPNASETIDGLTSFVMYPGEVRLVQCDGSALRSVVLSPFYRAFTATGTFTKPPGYSVFGGIAWGGGASGARSTSGATASRGGGGGGAMPFQIPAASFAATETMTVGAGGDVYTGSSGTGHNAGGNSTVGALLTVYGAANSGGGGYSSTTVQMPVGFEGGLWEAYNDSIYGGGGAMASSTGRSSRFGGAAGGSCAAGSVAYNGGTGLLGGSGGNASSASNGASGTAPGGGGGATQTGAQGGAGARGEIRIWGQI